MERGPADMSDGSFRGTRRNGKRALASSCNFSMIGVTRGSTSSPNHSHVYAVSCRMRPRVPATVVTRARRDFVARVPTRRRRRPRKNAKTMPFRELFQPCAIVGKRRRNGRASSIVRTVSIPIRIPEISRFTRGLTGYARSPAAWRRDPVAPRDLMAYNANRRISRSNLA